MPPSRIIGTGSYLPSRAVSNAEVTRGLRLGPEDVERLTGIRWRYWADDQEAASDLAEAAARRALEAASLAPAALDTILCSTTSPDTVLPSTACHVQRRLGAGRAAAFDVAASCSGFLYGLSMADALIRSGHSRRVLVVASEVKSRYLDPEDEHTAVLFGDGAGAAIVGAESDAAAGRESGLLGIRLHADGSRHA
ncbi:MAG: 3-oxoacyl-ACP synthase III family protein, partial [Nitrospirales bacterium]